MVHFIAAMLIGPVMGLKIMRAVAHLAFVSGSVFDRSGYCLPVIRLKIIAVLHILKPAYSLDSTASLPPPNLP